MLAILASKSNTFSQIYISSILILANARKQINKGFFPFHCPFTKLLSPCAAKS